MFHVKEIALCADETEILSELERLGRNLFDRTPRIIILENSCTF